MLIQVAVVKRHDVFFHKPASLTVGDVFDGCLFGFKICLSDHAGEPPVFPGIVFVFDQKGEELLRGKIAVVAAGQDVFERIRPWSRVAWI